MKKHTNLPEEIHTEHDSPWDWLIIAMALIVFGIIIFEISGGADWLIAQFV